MTENRLSLSNLLWHVPICDNNSVNRIMQAYQLPEFIARLLNHRGVAFDAVEGFLNPRLKTDFPDPMRMDGMDRLANDLADHIERGDLIGILGDFDVDGATSTAILYQFFKSLGMICPFYIPCRHLEGYGPNLKAFETLKSQGVTHILIADCGTTAVDIIAQGIELGLKISVLDHHEPAESLPPVTHIVNPKLDSCNSGYDYLAACGVCFLVCVATNTILRQRGYYTRHNKAEPPLKSWLELVALGSVCDMVPLVGANRLFVREGFKQMAENPSNIGLNALREIAGLKDIPTPDDAGFSLGPRINAGSRVDESDLGARLLTCDTQKTALSLATRLDQCNQERKALQSDMMKHASDIAAQESARYPNMIFVMHPDWHTGLVGLVAGRLKDHHHKPAIVATTITLPDGVIEVRGSGRSVKGINLADAFQAAEAKGLIIKGGGHAMAGGFTAHIDQIENFKIFLNDHFAQQQSQSPTHPTLDIDALLSVQGVRVDLVKMLHEKMSPFGMGNPEPLFMLQRIRIIQPAIVGRDHIRCLITDQEGGRSIKAMSFGSVGTAMGDAILSAKGSMNFDLVGCVKINSWQGNESAEIHIRDVRLNG